MIAAGRLRHRVTLYEQVNTQNPANGDIITTWQVFVAHVPAEIVAMSARDFIAAGAKQAEVTGRIVIRYMPGVLSSMRAVDDDNGTVYAIVGNPIPDPESGRSHLTLTVKAGVTDGR